MADTLPFSALPGWQDDDHASAWRVFHASCVANGKRKTPPRPGRMQDTALRAVCNEAIRLSADVPPQKAKDFFETHFEPVKPGAGEKGFMTGYYEPEFLASKMRSDIFLVPVLRRPSDLVSNLSPPGHAELTAARRGEGGGLAPYADRAAIEDGALQGKGLEIFWMKDGFDLFTMQVQGSGRLRLPDGGVARLGYDGKNGQPYTSVGKVLVDRGLLQKGSVSMQAIAALFKKDARLAREAMRENKSYVFFKELKNADPASGPLGGQGLPLTPFRSIAIDAKIYSYGLPFYIDGALPRLSKKDLPFRRLVIAQDTGTAITGPARIDLFTGWGDEAAELAGLLQQRVDLYVLKPRDAQ